MSYPNPPLALMCATTYSGDCPWLPLPGWVELVPGQVLARQTVEENEYEVLVVYRLPGSTDDDPSRHLGYAILTAAQLLDCDGITSDPSLILYAPLETFAYRPLTLDHPLSQRRRELGDHVGDKPSAEAWAQLGLTPAVCQTACAPEPHEGDGEPPWW
ncbi:MULTISPECIES: hypothetical protein [unclassified Crossiella]|uniref:hypothetical protein n=1 Tax=unclassified Crossiella TaxID=2620835 RepID=UPI001FFEB1EE|nr:MULTISPECIES: hypothetical protein [unclassified Crossiella]MCK2239995.1 hypothetical protein [Crossiella sp. S99.2]MCK2252703.1 hypothetical protein [Crossiella sp. S99.1]